MRREAARHIRLEAVTVIGVSGRGSWSVAGKHQRGSHGGCHDVSCADAQRGDDDEAVGVRDMKR